MRFHHTLILATLLTSFSASAFELIMIQAVSNTKKTFVTRHGKREGVVIGNTATFTAEDISINAKAVSVTSNFTQWEIVNQNARFPFEKGTMVTYYPANEYVWALSTEPERKKYIKSMIPTLKQSFTFRAGLSRGLSESVSDAPVASSRRGGIQGEVYYERDLTHHIAFDVGFRYDSEVLTIPNASYTTKRAMVVADILYYFDQLKDIIKGEVYVGVGTGWGYSSTETVGLSQSGNAMLLPALKLGISLPFNEDYEFLMDTAFDTIQTKESQESGKVQSTNQTNAKVGIGLRKFF